MIKFLAPILLALYADSQDFFILLIIAMLWLSAVVVQDSGLFKENETSGSK